MCWYLFPHSVIDDSLEDKDMRDLKMLRMHFHLQATDKDYDLKPATCGQRNREFHLMPDEVDSESRTSAAFFNYMYQGGSDGLFKKCQ